MCYRSSLPVREVLVLAVLGARCMHASIRADRASSGAPRPDTLRSLGYIDIVVLEYG